MLHAMKQPCNVSTKVPAAIGDKAPLYKVYTSDIPFQVNQAPIILLHITYLPTLMRAYVQPRSTHLINEL